MHIHNVRWYSFNLSACIQTFIDMKCVGTGMHFKLLLSLASITHSLVPPWHPGGGYSSLLSPTQRRFSYSESGRNSVSASSRVLSAYPMGGSFGIDDYFAESEGDDEADDEFDPMTTASTSQPRPGAPSQPYEPSSDARTPTLLLSVPPAVRYALWLHRYE